MDQSLVKSSKSTQTLAFDAQSPIVDQKETHWQIAASLVAKWWEVERIILKAPDIAGREQSTEEVSLMLAMMRKYATLTPRQIGDAIRKAADIAQAECAANSRLFPKLYLADIEHEIQEMILKAAKAKPEVLQLEANTGGNSFWGEPSEALAREWPAIVAHTELMRGKIENGKTIRYMFWKMGDEVSRQASLSMLRQMVQEMHDAGNWDLSQNQWEALAIWQSWFCELYQNYGHFTEGMSKPISDSEVEAIKLKLAGKLAYATKSPSAPTLVHFPLAADARSCAVFDAYWKFWEGLNHAD